MRRLGFLQRKRAMGTGIDHWTRWPAGARAGSL